MAEEYVLARPAPLTIRIEDADRLLALGSGDAALLYLWVLKNGGRFDPARAAPELKLSLSLEACMALLRGAGLIRGAEEGPRQAPEREELPEVTVEELKKLTEGDPGFRRVLEDSAERLGRVLTGGDMKILFGIYHDLGLPTEVISMLVNYCTEEIRRRFGPGRKPTLRQIEKQAYVWSREELFTMDLADRWLKERAGKRSRAEELARLLGIQNRSPAPSEEKYLLAWLDMGFDREALLRAYDKTIYKKGELAWPYMNRILENWHAKGLHTLPEIEAGDRPPRQAKGGARAPAGPTPEEYERMQRYLNKLNGGGDHGT